MSDRNAYVARAVRSVIGKERGTLAGFEAEALAGGMMRELLARSGVEGVDRVLLANTTNAGNVARTAALAAGLDVATPATTVNNQCSGGLTAIRLGCEAIEAGAADLVLAGGVESVSHTTVDLGGGVARRGRGNPLPRVRHAPAGWPDPELGASADATAAALGIGREEQDAFARESYARAAARADGALEGWRAALGDAVDDELAARRAPSLERLRRYPAAFTEGGSVTAGNCAAAADGAAMALLGSVEALQVRGLRPIARVVATVSAAGDTAMPALAVIPAIEGALARAGLDVRDIDLWEVNEAFAVKVVAVMRRFDLERARVNVLGGAIAYGHPFGASGAMLLVHLLAALEAHGGRCGLAAIAGAGGVAEAMVIERVGWVSG